MLAVLVTHHRWPLFDFTGAGTPSTPQDGAYYMLDPVAFRQSVVLRSMRNGAAVGAGQGGATGFVGGEILGGEVTGGATGIPGAAPGGFVGAPSEL